MLNFDVIRHARPAIASSVTYVVPIFALIVGAAFLGETVHWYEPVGAALILLGAAISQDRVRLGRRLDQPSPRRLAEVPSGMQKTG
jgi:drug/metabolite transporter (DMT)-like permease